MKNSPDSPIVIPFKKAIGSNIVSPWPTLHGVNKKVQFVKNPGDLLLQFNNGRVLSVDSCEITLENEKIFYERQPFLDDEPFYCIFYLTLLSFDIFKMRLIYDDGWSMSTVLPKYEHYALDILNQCEPGLNPCDDISDFEDFNNYLKYYYNDNSKMFKIELIDISVIRLGF